MINENDITIVVCVDRNKKYVTSTDSIAYRWYEHEAVSCVRCIRQNGGVLSQADILCVLASDSIQQKTLQRLKDCSARCVQLGCKPDYSHQFLVALQAQATALQNSTRDFFICLDADMQMKAPFSQYQLQLLDGHVSIAEYDSRQMLSQTDELKYRFNNLQKNNGKCFNTYFVAFNRENAICDKLLALAGSKEYERYFNDRIYYYGDDYFYEEGLYDYLYLHDDDAKMKIRSVDSFTLERDFFLHKHLTSADVAKIELA